MVLTTGAAKICTAHNNRLCQKYCTDCDKFVCNTCIFNGCDNDHNIVAIWDLLDLTITGTDVERTKLRNANQDYARNKAAIENAFVQQNAKLLARKRELIQELDRRNTTVKNHVLKYVLAR